MIQLQKKHILCYKNYTDISLFGKKPSLLESVLEMYNKTTTNFIF